MFVVVINLICICVPKKKKKLHFSGSRREVETHKNFLNGNGKITPVTSQMVRSLAQERRVHPSHLALVLIYPFF